MPAHIRPFEPSDLPAVVELSVRAWAPVFASLRAVLGADIFARLHPDWRTSQEQAVTATCTGRDMDVWVSDDEDRLVGFVAFAAEKTSGIGVIEMLAVDPDRHGAGIGTALTSFALEALRAAGMRVAMVETGGDPGHAAARRTYAKAGFTLLPVARYFAALDPTEHRSTATARPNR